MRKKVKDLMIGETFKAQMPGLIGIVGGYICQLNDCSADRGYPCTQIVYVVGSNPAYQYVTIGDEVEVEMA